MSDRVAFLYRWTNKLTGKWYIGSRTAKGCHLADGYICSSKIVLPMIIENKDDWTREILVISYPDYILALETRLLLSLDAKDNPMSFNKHNGDGIFVSFGDSNPMKDPKIVQRFKEAVTGIKHWSKNRPAEYNNRQKGQKRPTITGDKHPNKNALNSAKISDSLKGKKHLYAIGDKNVMCDPLVAAKLSGDNHWMNKQDKVTCEHCGLKVDKSNHTRWHGPKCKKKEGRV